MENKIKIIQAISQCNSDTGSSAKRIEKALRFSLWPNASDVNRKQSLYHLKRGSKKSITLEQVQIICEVTGCDANFLFGIN